MCVYLNVYAELVRLGDFNVSVTMWELQPSCLCNLVGCSTNSTISMYRWPVNLGQKGCSKSFIAQHHHVTNNLKSIFFTHKAQCRPWTKMRLSKLTTIGGLVSQYLVQSGVTMKVCSYRFIVHFYYINFNTIILGPALIGC